MPPALGSTWDPTLVEQIFSVVRKLMEDTGMSVLLLEQNVGAALKVSDRGYVMRAGRVVLEENAAQMRARDSYWDFF